MWISQENANSRWPQDNQSSTQSGTQETLCLSFPKKARLLVRKDFLKTSRQGAKHFGIKLIIDYRWSSTKRPSRLGITVSKKFGNAVKRNRFKRCLREAFRLCQFPESLDLNVHPKGTFDEIFFESILSELKNFLSAITKEKS